MAKSLEMLTYQPWSTIKIRVNHKKSKYLRDQKNFIGIKVSDT
jgi:hypothetical protein